MHLLQPIYININAEILKTKPKNKGLNISLIFI